ncbi:hypothetical protein [Methylomonas sp. AM2-LC]|uniref:hypothetical protein n=1 Tax=Methylomonas sp. AM2-LC TaxID=3153301 RepID=UPI003263EB1E
MKQHQLRATPHAINAAQQNRTFCDAHPPSSEEPVVFDRLLECLNYALAIDDSVNLALVLGMTASLSNQEALAHWVRNETQGNQFLDASALFNFLVNQLEKLLAVVGRNS